MIVTTVAVFVKPEKIEEFIEATRINHENSIKEKENMRFDVLQSITDPCRFTLYEAYETEEGAIAHKATSHYKVWRETVESMMAKPREGVSNKVIAPLDRVNW